MGLDPEFAHILWIAGLVMLGLFIVFKFAERKRFKETRIVRRGRFRTPDPDQMQDLAPMLRRARIQIVLSALALLILFFIAFMGIGEKPVGIPLPKSLFDVFR